MKHETYHEEPGLGGYFPGREKQDVFLAAPRDGFTVAREMPSQSRRRSTKKRSFMNSMGYGLAGAALNRRIPNAGPAETPVSGSNRTRIDVFPAVSAVGIG